LPYEEFGEITPILARDAGDEGTLLQQKSLQLV
jgi:hypothetical protein